MILASLLLAAAPALPDLPAPLGRLDSVLERPTGGVPADERIVDLAVPGCPNKVPINVTRFAAGTMFALQQLVEWMHQTEGLEAQLFAEGTINQLSTGFSKSLIADTKACKPPPKELATAPKLCPGNATDHAWFLAEGKPVVAVQWAPSSGKNKCAPRLTGTMFDAKQVARVRYVADYGAAAQAALIGDKCQVVFTFDAAKEVFHAVRRGCKGS